MTRTRMIKMMILVAAVLICTSFAGAIFQYGIDGKSIVSTAQDVPEENGNSLASFVVTDDENTHGEHEQRLSEDGILNERGRLTQRVTIYDENGTLPISGTVTKSEDGFYPGTYELTFSKNIILNKPATIQVKIDVEAGQPVYILTGSKEKGYRQVASVEADDDKCVFFQTQLLQKYTLSTTDICGAQAAMANYQG
ncbi:hypothetical protein [Butyrivibrio sp. MC2021]|uniref:hypothetical protein n=1 Tax=Butyrivibrio sp. MC2021 TaxID=1408306 RepID=UPI00047895D3|nr:hypothetical protein [Butyrivibrio sp. MC2021]